MLQLDGQLATDKFDVDEYPCKKMESYVTELHQLLMDEDNQTASTAELSYDDSSIESENYDDDDEQQSAISIGGYRSSFFQVRIFEINVCT